MLLKSCLLFTTTLSVGLAMPADAQEAGSGAPNAASSGDIIVTARRVEERLQDVPISITVYNQEQLTKFNVATAQDLAKFTPSLSANSNFGSQNSTFAIRGFVQDIGTQPSVGVYFADVIAPVGVSNGVPAGNGAGPGSFFDLQNVQVLKGPQGTLFGRNTTGGDVLLVPQKPTHKTEGYVEASMGNYGMWRVQGAINLPITDTLRVRLSGDSEHRGGYLRNTSGIGPSRFNDIGYYALRASIVADLAPDLENYTIVSYSHSDTRGDVQKVIAAHPYNAQTALLGNLAGAQLASQAAGGEGFYDIRSDVPDPVSRLSTWQIINTTTWKASDSLTIKNIASYAQLKDTVRTAQFGTDFHFGTLPIGFTYILSAPGLPLSYQSTFTDELQFQGSNGPLTWQAGAFFESSKPLGLSGAENPTLLSCSSYSPFSCVDPVAALAGRAVGSLGYSVGRTSFRDTGIYGQGSFSLTDKLKLTAGLRYTWDKQDGDSTLISYVLTSPFNPATLIATCTRPETAVPNCSEHLQTTSRKPTWMIDLDYKPIDDMLLYAKYSRGYRAGGVKVDSPAPYNVFQPEKLDAYEIGVKSTFRGAIKGTFNLAAFYNDFSNQQLQLGFNINLANPNSHVAPTAGPVNVGRSRIYGLEADTNVKIFRGFSLSAGYTYLNTRILQVNLPTLDPVTSPYLIAANMHDGDELVLAPKHKFSITAAYTLPLSKNVGEITVSANDTYTSSQRTNYADRAPALLALAGGVDLGILPALNLVNLNADWKGIGGTPFDLGLFATNVTKRQYYTFIPGLGGGSGFDVGSVGEPRMYGMRLKAHF